MTSNKQKDGMEGRGAQRQAGAKAAAVPAAPRPVSTTPAGRPLEGDGAPGTAQAKPRQAGPGTDSEVFRAFTGQEREQSFADSKRPIEPADRTGKTPEPAPQQATGTEARLAKLEGELASAKEKNRTLHKIVGDLTTVVGELDETVKGLGRSVAKLLDGKIVQPGDEDVTNIVREYDLDVEGSRLVHVEETARPVEGGLIDMKKLKRAPKIQATVRTVAPDITEMVFSVVDAALSQASTKFVTLEQLNGMIDKLNARFDGMAKAVMGFVSNNRRRLAETLAKPKPDKGG